MRILIFAVVVAVTCSQNFSARAGSLAEFDKNVDCARAPQATPARKIVQLIRSQFRAARKW